MPTTKHELLDWLMDVPEDAEIGTDGAGLALLAILGTNVHLLEIGRIPNADELYTEAINQAMLERLRRIHAAGGDTETGVIIVTFQGYISGIPTLFSTDFNTGLYSRIQNRQKALSQSLLTSFTIRRFSIASKIRKSTSLRKSNTVGHSRPRPKHLAKKLLQIRRSLGMSQGEMVRRLGVQALIDHTTISKYELDKTNRRSRSFSPMPTS